MKLSLVSLVVVAMATSVVAQDEEVNIMVPAYFYPSVPAGASGWAALNAAASALSNRVVAIANPSDGPGNARLPEFTTAIASLQRSSGRVIGYVLTHYSTRSLDLVKADVDTWYAFYPSLNGIFFDEVNYTLGQEAYYQNLYNYVHSKSTSPLVVNNPGTSTLPSYLFYNGARVADVICIFEGSGSDALKWTKPSWTSSYPRANFCALAYDVPDVNISSVDYGDIVDHAYQQNLGWVYVTDDKLDNPWDTIATYFSKEVDYIKDSNSPPS